MLFVVGDIHGEYNVLHNNVANMIVKLDQAPVAILQVGDFGFYIPYVNYWNNEVGIPVYYIDGNHEDFDAIKHNPNRKGLTYMPRGSVMEIDGKLIAFCGGACSVDRYWRSAKNWWAEETVTEEDVERTINELAGRKPDYLITHAPPTSVIATHFPRLIKSKWGLPEDWVDMSSIRIQSLWDKLDNPMIISGHMHKSIVGPNYRILDIGEVLVLP